jgi:hypothetical protein
MTRVRRKTFGLRPSLQGPFPAAPGMSNAQRKDSREEKKAQEAPRTRALSTLAGFLRYVAPSHCPIATFSSFFPIFVFIPGRRRWARAARGRHAAAVRRVVPRAPVCVGG